MSPDGLVSDEYLLLPRVKLQMLTGTNGSGCLRSTAAQMYEVKQANSDRVGRPDGCHMTACEPQNFREEMHDLHFTSLAHIGPLTASNSPDIEFHIFYSV